MHIKHFLYIVPLLFLFTACPPGFNDGPLVEYPPQAPENLSIQVNGNTVNFNWTDVATDEENYLVFHSTSSLEPTGLADKTLAANSESTSLQVNFASDQNNYFWVMAENSAGRSSGINKSRYQYGSMTNKVILTNESGDWNLYVNGSPFYINGVGGESRLELASSLGANSLRTWGSDEAAETLGNAAANDMKVSLGIWLSHNNADYSSASYKNQMRQELQGLLDQYRNHDALLLWALGNEIDIAGANTQEAWSFVEELAQMVKAQDPHHPVMTVITHNGDAVENVADYAPSVDILGVNAYTGVEGVPDTVANNGFDGPYVVTEWGPDGHWEWWLNTDWGVPKERNSSSKASQYSNRYVDAIQSGQSSTSLGSYVFLWGQKQERTPTWYSLFMESNVSGLPLLGERTEIVDVMAYMWSGTYPTEKAPSVTGITLDGQDADDNASVIASASMDIVVTASDANGDDLEYVFEILKRPTVLGSAGSFEPRPDRVGTVITQVNDGTLTMNAPSSSGDYRLFVYVLDGTGRAGYANIPFQVN